MSSANNTSEVTMEKKILVVYFSRTGNSKKVAMEIGRQLVCDVLEIKSSPGYPKGFWGYQRALLHAAFKRIPSIQIESSNITKYDLVVVGGPMWGSSLSSPVRGFLSTYRGQLKDVAFFVTQGGNFARDKIKKQMSDVCGKSPGAFLAIAEQDMRDGSYAVKVSSFIDQLDLKAKKPIGQKRPPESFASL
jgi:flavodoxin